MTNDKKQVVLIVDDDPYVLKILTHQLTSLGYGDIVTCEAVQQAIKVLDEDVTAVGLIFSDLQMPELDGIEFVRYLVRREYTGIFVLVSGEDERILHTAERLARAHSLNVLPALRKPISLHQLKHILASNDIPSRLQPAFAKGAAVRKTYDTEDLKHALTKGELVNYYQPKVSVSTGKIVGVETLVRWLHPEDGLLFPDRFIYIAEEGGLINDLTRTVLTSALHQARQWRNVGLELSVAVNISMNSLTSMSMDFPDFVSGEIVKTDVPASALTLEVKERKLMIDPVSSMDILTRLRLKGINLSIDDFGEGHSSFSQLRDAPFNEIKIDRGFVHGAWKNEAAKVIFDASLNLAKQLGLKIVAEGVEDRADWNFLRKTKCDMAQGYFIGRPMLGDLVQDWINDWEYRDLSAAIV